MAAAPEKLSASFMDYVRVNTILKSEPGLSHRLSSPSVSMSSSTGRCVLFPQEVADVCDRLCAAGEIVQHTSRVDLVRAALAVMQISDPNPVKPEKLVESALLEPAAAKLSPPVAVLPVVKAKRKRRTRAEMAADALLEEAAKTAGADQLKAPLTKPVPVKPLPASDAASLPDAVIAVPAPVKFATDPSDVSALPMARLAANFPPHLLYSPMFSHAAALEQFMENLDRQPGWEERLQSIKRLTNTFAALAKVPKQLAAFS